MDLPSPPQGAANALRDGLQQCGYTPEAVLERVGLHHAWTFLPPMRPLLLADLQEADKTPLNDAIQALFLNEPVGASDSAWFTAARHAGLLVPGADDTWEAPFIVWPYRDLLLVSDPPGPRGMRLQGPRLPMRTRVFPVDASTDLLWQSLLPMREGARVVDVGCGTGALSIALARQGAHVTGTDLNPRSVEFARFNESLNGQSGIDWRHGDLLAPVEGQTFDRVVSNLPFVPTPGPHALYWDGGYRGQELVARLMGHLHETLVEGGVAQFTAGLVNPSTEDVLANLVHYLGDARLSVLALYGTPQSMNRSIPLLATSEADLHEDDYPQAVLRWRNAARTADVHEVAPAVVTVRRDNAGMRAAFPMGPSSHDFGSSVQKLLKAWDRLARLPMTWDAWRGVRLVPSGAIRLLHDTGWDGQDWKSGRSRLQFDDRPWRLPQSMGRDSVRILMLCDGLRSLEDIVFAFCMQNDKDPLTVRTLLMDALPSWVSGGILTFAAVEA